MIPKNFIFVLFLIFFCLAPSPVCASCEIQNESFWTVSCRSPPGNTPYCVISGFGDFITTKTLPISVNPAEIEIYGQEQYLTEELCLTSGCNSMGDAYGVCTDWGDYWACDSGDEIYQDSCSSPTPTPTPSDNCVSACGYTWTAGFTADDILLLMCMETAGRTPVSSCNICGWQMAAMQQQYPCSVPPSVVPTYSPTPLPTVPPPPTALPTLPPGPSPGPQVIAIGENDVHDVDFQIPTIATIEMSGWNKTTERNNITSVVGNITDPYFNTVDGFSVLISQIIQRLLYLPNWVMASIYSTVQPIAKAFTDIIVVVAEWGSVPLQLMRLALDNTPFGIQALLIYGVCLEMIIYLLRGET